MQQIPDEFSPQRCWDLLASQTMGRVALSLQALPTILPVEYYVDGPDLAICLGSHRVAPRSVDQVVLAFSVDSIEDGVGWAIHAQGQAEFRRRSDMDPSCGQPPTGQLIHLTPTRLSGGRIELCPVSATIADWSTS